MTSSVHSGTHNVCTPPSGRVEGCSVNPVLSPVLISNLLANEENGIASGHSINDKAELEPRSPDTEQNKLFSCFFFFFLIYLLIFYFYFLAVLGLRFCARAFSSCGKRGPLFIAVRGPLTVAASPVAEHRLQTRRLSSCGSRA